MTQLIKLRASYEMATRKRIEAIKVLREMMESKDKQVSYELMNCHNFPGSQGPTSTTALF